MPGLAEPGRLVPVPERELIKLPALSDALAAAPVRRGFDERTARLATDV